MLREPLRPFWRRVAHGLLLLCGWAVFFGFWWKVLRRPLAVGPLFVVIPLIAIVVPAVTFYWIMHNIHLYRRRDARRSATPPMDRYEQDWYGRRVVADWERMRGAREIAIEIAGDVKRYEVSE